jgi:hypothetical protein
LNTSRPVQAPGSFAEQLWRVAGADHESLRLRIITLLAVRLIFECVCVCVWPCVCVCVCDMASTFSTSGDGGAGLPLQVGGEHATPDSAGPRRRPNDACPRGGPRRPLFRRARDVLRGRWGDAAHRSQSRRRLGPSPGLVVLAPAHAPARRAPTLIPASARWYAAPFAMVVVVMVVMTVPV